MKRSLPLLLLIAFTVAGQQTAAAYELTGWVEAEGRYFPKEPLYSEQVKDSGSLAVQAELYHEWKTGVSFTLTSFYRWDGADNERTHFDVREAMLLWPKENFELRIGIGKVFWGVTESRHLVDVINQTDLIESLNEEDKLGQPMVNLTLLTRLGTLDFFVLPYFRERTFPGEKGRLRAEPLIAIPFIGSVRAFIDADRAVYESSEKERHVDFAVRYGNTVGDWDFGVSHFYGTSREPGFQPMVIDPMKPEIVLAPFYELIHQTGLELQLVQNAWLWKLEALYRSGQDAGNFYAAVAGFEYTIPGLDLGGADIGLLAEYLHDARESGLETTYDNDYFLAMRVALNDTAGSELLAGYLHDANRSSAIMVVEASRRIGDMFKAELEAYLFINPAKDDLLYFLRNDGFFQFTLIYFF